MSVTINLDNARHVWEENLSIVAVWLFGSATEGIIKPGSDLDIAILFFSSPSLDQLTSICASLQEILKFEKIDIMILNSASTISSMEAVSGKSIFCRDKNKRAEFVSLLARQYEDDIAFLEKSLHLSPIVT